MLRAKPDRDREHPLDRDGADPNHPFAKGDRITAVRACDGGYGDPLARDPADVLDEDISIEKVLADYGLVITTRLEVDASATARERDQRRSAARS